MVNPLKASDENGEWFELYNYQSTAINLDGFIIHDNSTTNAERHVISGNVTIQGSSHFVLGINSNTSLNGNVTIDYQYNNISLADDTDVLILEDPSGCIVFVLQYDLYNYPSPRNGSSIALLDYGIKNVNSSDSSSVTILRAIGTCWTLSSEHRRDNNLTANTYGWGDYGSPGLFNPGASLVVITNSTLTEMNYSPSNTYPLNNESSSDDETVVVILIAAVGGGGGCILILLLVFAAMIFTKRRILKEDDWFPLPARMHRPITEETELPELNVEEQSHIQQRIDGNYENEMYYDYEQNPPEEAIAQANATSITPDHNPRDSSNSNSGKQEKEEKDKKKKQEKLAKKEEKEKKKSIRTFRKTAEKNSHRKSLATFDLHDIDIQKKETEEPTESEYNISNNNESNHPTTSNINNNSDNNNNNKNNNNSNNSEEEQNRAPSPQGDGNGNRIPHMITGMVTKERERALSTETSTKRQALGPQGTLPHLKKKDNNTTPNQSGEGSPHINEQSSSSESLSDSDIERS